MSQLHRSRGLRMLTVPIVVAILTILSACGGPAGPTPSIAIALDTAAASVLRGGSVDVTVTLTRVGNATAAVDLTIDGLPAGVAASFAPATLTGGVLTSTLTIQADAGAAETSTGLTVTATSGTLTDDAALTLDVESLTVTGSVVGPLDLPMSGVTVASQGESTFTNADGAFTLSGLSVPYDVAVSAAMGDGGVHVFEGMTTATPVLSPYFGLAMMGGVPPSTATIGGSALGGAAVGANRAVVVCVEGNSVAVYGCDYVSSGATNYSVDAGWFEPGDVDVTVHAVHLEWTADGTPLAYLGYDTFDLVLTDAGAEVQDLTLEPVPSHLVTGTIEPGIGVTTQGTVGFVRFGETLSMAVYEAATATNDLSVLMPDIPGVTYDFWAVGSGPGGISNGWVRGVGVDAGTVALPAPAELLAPADLATDVDLTTTFSATDVGGPTTFLWTPDVAGPTLALTTTRTSVTIPDPAIGGFAMPSGADYDWAVAGHGPATMEMASAGGISDYYELVVLLESGGPRFASDGAITATPSRSFQFAP